MFAGVLQRGRAVGQISVSRFAGFSRPVCNALLVLASLSTTCWVFASAQTAPPTPRTQATRDKSPTAAAVPALPASAAPVPAPVAPAAVPQKPVSAPVISWDGSRISIDAENATLSDILLAIRGRTGASIEMPPGVSSERVAVHLGPAPVREVISSLLYGTDFDYIIQAPDDDPNGLRRVILTARGKEDGKDDGDDTTVAIDAPKPRMMKGWAAPGKTDFEVAHQSEAEAAAQSDAEVPADATPTTAAADSGTATPDPAASTAQNSAASDSAAASAPTEAATASLTTGEQSVSANRSAVTTSQEGSPTDSPISQMEQNMQRMYEQRRQIQMQQNQSAQGPKAP